MGFNPVKEGGLEAGRTYDAKGNLIGDRVVWALDVTRDDMERMFSNRWAFYAIVRNNSDQAYLVTDEPSEGERYAYDLVEQGITDWHILHYPRVTIDEMGERVREEPDEIIAWVRDCQKRGVSPRV